MSQAARNVPSTADGPNNSLSERVRSLRLPARAAEPRGSGWISWTVAVVFALIAAFLALEAFTPIDDESLKALAEERFGGVGPGMSAAVIPVPARPGAKAAATATAPATAADGGIVHESKGYIVPISVIQVSPLVGGRVIKLAFKEGDTVTKGTFLAQIEKTEFQADFDRIEAQIAAASAKIEELSRYRTDEIKQAETEFKDAEAQREQLYADYVRSIDLRRTRALAPKEFEQAESSYRSADFRMQRLRLALELLRKGPRDARIAQVEAERAQYRAERYKAKWRLDNTKIVAPIDGTILSKKAEEGNFVNPSAFSNGLSASVCEMADLAKMEVDLSISERDVAKVFVQQECKVRAEAYPERDYKGYVSRIMPQADRAKGAVPVRVMIHIPRREAGQYLRPEMGALVTFYDRKVAPPVK